MVSVMTNAEQYRLLEKLANMVELQATPGDAARIIKEVQAQSLALSSYTQTVNEEAALSLHETARKSLLSIETLSKYRQFFEMRLHVSIEQMSHAKGVVLSPHEEMYSKPTDWMTYIPVCAFESERAVFISCIPEWECDIRVLLEGAETSEAIPRMNEFAEKKAFLVGECRKVYGLETPNPQIDPSEAIQLDYAQYNQYWEFKRKMYPAIYELIEQDKQMEEDYRKMVDERTSFCVIREDEIVSLATLEPIPNKPEGIVNLGISTLKDYRRNGNGEIACAALINHYFQKGLRPIWQCEQNNTASQLLAEKLGFRCMGNVFDISTLAVCWNNIV